MKIKEFSISRYGPLKETGLFRLGNFNIFYGKNEEGKTLTIDAMVKLLLKGSRRAFDKIFEKIDRVEEEPVGFIILIDERGKEIKIPEKGDITKFVNITPYDFRNIFIIRNSDLAFKEEEKFFRRVTDRLTGLRTEEIQRIKEKIQVIGKLTRPDSRGTLSDDKSYNKIKSRVDRAKELIEKIESLQKQAKRENLDILEETLGDLEEEIKLLRRKISSMEEARRRIIYEKGKNSLRKLKDILETLKKLEIYNDDDLSAWREYERDIEKYKEEKESLLERLDKLEVELGEKTGELRNKNREFEIEKEKKRKIEEIKPNILNYEKDFKEFKGKEKIMHIFKNLSWFFTFTLILSLLGTLLRFSLFFVIFSSVSLLLSLIFWLLRIQMGREEAQLAKNFEGIKLDLSRYNIGGNDIKEILSSIQKFEDEFEKLELELKDLEQNVLSIQKEIKRLEETEIRVKDEKIQEALNRIERLKRESKVDSLEEYKKRLEMRREYDTKKMAHIAVLKSHFGAIGDRIDENISYWEKKIDELKGYKDKALDMDYDEDKYKELKEKERELSTELEKTRKRMEGFQYQLKQIGTQVSQHVRLDEQIICETLADLEEVKRKLREFVRSVMEKKENSIEVMRIFEEIEKEEEEKVSHLFGKESHISKYFNEITGGFYEVVEFLPEDKKIQVLMKNGERLDVYKLSGGAYDQLYFSIRLALGEKLLKGMGGFFILDDPFIKADMERLERQMELLKRISSYGWQILYFTAKDEILKVLDGDIKDGKVILYKIHNITF
jgi:DNA repair exonuclease SbcCD ATPase subunit